MGVSRLRERILSEHEHLRRLLSEVNQQAFQVSIGGARDGVDALRALGLQLLMHFREHLALEDRLLAPALRRVDGTGRERAERLDADHREQRELLDYLLDNVRDQSRPGAVLAAEWRSLVELLLDDMAREERTILDPEGAMELTPAASPSPGSTRSIGH